MPNYCTNILVIRVDKTRVLVKDRQARLAVFQARAIGFADDTGAEDDTRRVLDFNRFLPYPESFNEQDRRARDEEAALVAVLRTMTPEDQCTYRQTHPYHKDGFNSGGYEWRVSTWGTKWNACSPTVTRLRWDTANPRLRYDFDTAWSIPLGVLLKMSTDFPDLVFYERWREEGGDHGHIVLQAGQQLS